jgi:curved DNA-binding protein CbpA
MRRRPGRSEDPFSVLDVAPSATDEQVRAAWLEAVRLHPPDRDPEAFRRIREAYETLQKEEDRLSYRLFGMPGIQNFADLARRFEGEPRRCGVGLWREILRERPS